MDGWMDTIEMYLVLIGLAGVGWIGLIQDRYNWRALLNAVMKLWIP
jgi:hypothetical protein